MSKLIKLNTSEDKALLNDILNDELIVIEDIQGSKIWIKWDGQNFEIRPKSITNEPINLIDLAMQNYYNPVTKFFSELDDRVKSLLNRKWWFCFEYFPDEQPANIEYSRVPKNHLVLSSINKGGKFEFNIEELDEYARLFDVDLIPVIYQGQLTETMKEAIIYFLNTSEEDLEYVFGDKSFSYFFYKILNPISENSFLMEEDFQQNLEKLIIRSSKRDISFELLNPLYKRMNDSNTTEFVEIYTLILINFLNFCQSVQLESVKLKGDTKEEMYIYLICKLFNIYVSEVKEDLLNFDFVVPEFFDKEKFKINTELIKNKLTKDYLKEDDKLEYIFKVILGSFNKKRKKPIGIFTENTVKLFNKFVDDIEVYLGRYLNKIQEIELGRAGLLDFGDFFDIQYDTDAEGQVYPDVYDEFEKEEETGKKKKGKGGKFPVGAPTKEAPSKETPTK
jgi:hypothetical protein